MSAVYREFAPPPPLASHVACLWERAGGPPPRVLPDGCADIVWTGTGLIVAGPATQAVVPHVPRRETKLGIRFRVGAAGAALGLPAGELRDLSPALGEIWEDGNELEERLREAGDARARAVILAGAIARRLAAAPAPDPLVRAAVLDLGRARARIGRLGARLGLSDRQLRRRFAGAVGYSPATLARVLRLQRFLSLAGDGGDLGRLAADAGYADQPHLTRDCRELAGLPAATLLAAGGTPAGERLSSA